MEVAQAEHLSATEGTLAKQCGNSEGPPPDDCIHRARIADTKAVGEHGNRAGSRLQGLGDLLGIGRRVTKRSSSRVPVTESTNDGQLEHCAHLRPLDLTSGAGRFVGVLVVFGKAFFLVFVMIWLRWSLPRFRYDQLLRFAWKFMLPLAMANLIVTVVAVWAIRGAGA